MATTINAGNATTGAAISADTTGILQLQSGSTPTTAVTIDTSQNVGIGVTPFANSLTNGSLDLAGGAGLFGYSTNSYLSANMYYNGGWKYKANGYGTLIEQTGFDGLIKFSRFASGTAGNTGTILESMRIDSNANLLVGQTSATLALAGSCQIANASGLGQFSGGDGSLARTFSFGRDNVTTGAFVFTFNGSVISQIGAGTGIYTAVSDSRLKKNITPLNYGLNEILELNPVMYNMKTESDDTKKHIGLLAQEVKSVIDESVNDLVTLTEEMIAAGAKEQYYGLDKSGLVPVLIKAIQELNAKVDAQATTIAELQSRLPAENT